MFSEFAKGYFLLLLTVVMQLKTQTTQSSAEWKQATETSALFKETVFPHFKLHRFTWSECIIEKILIILQ